MYALYQQSILIQTLIVLDQALDFQFSFLQYFKKKKEKIAQYILNENYCLQNGIGKNFENKNFVLILNLCVVK